MKKFSIFMVVAIMSSGAMGAGAPVLPPTCRVFSFYDIVKADQILTEGSCPSGYKLVGTVESCIKMRAPGCYMYAPADMEFSDEIGTFTFVGDVCPLE